MSMFIFILSTIALFQFNETRKLKNKNKVLDRELFNTQKAVRQLEYKIYQDGGDYKDFFLGGTIDSSSEE